jgi:hypothetical protein
MYGYRIASPMAVVVHYGLANLEIGPVSHAKGPTMANRMRFSKHGKILTNHRLLNEFIIGVYSSFWFEIKVKHNFIDGSGNRLNMMELP